METFKDIQGYENFYQISDLGNVKALARSVINKRGNLQNYPERILKSEIMDEGCTNYNRVTLSKNHKSTRYLVHRLVATHFIENPDNKPFVNHIDNNGTNNILTNLEWCTHSENMIHAQRQGRLLLSQSKGGRTAGIAGERALKRATDLVGSRIFLWYVVSYHGKRGGRKKRHYVNCICTGCNTLRPVLVWTLVTNRSRGCTGCARKIKDEEIV